MTFEQAVEHLQGLQGELVDVRVRLPRAPKDSYALVSVVGRVDRVDRAGAREAWIAWLREGDEPLPSAPHVLLDRRTFESAWTRFDGTTHTLSVRHAGVVTDIAVWI